MTLFNTVTTGVDPEKLERISRYVYNNFYGPLYLMLVDGRLEGWVYYLIAIAIVLSGYFLGSMNFAVIISKLKFHEDIRTKGSGNAGATNMSRTYGKAAGIATLLGDILKTVLPVLLARFLVGDMFGYITGFMCALGHAFPCYYKFKGGKCVAVTAAVLLVMEPLAFLILLFVFAAVVLATKYVSLASIFTALISPVIVHNFIKGRNFGQSHLGLVFLIAQCLLVIILHKENIKRLLNGKENKFAFKKKKNENNGQEK
jgi:glycerol-3-phosphate acyltransferase PlsY